MMPIMDPRLMRLKQLTDEFTAHPGAAPGGSGDTGLASTDSLGYSALLDRRKEYTSLLAGLKSAAGSR